MIDGLPRIVAHDEWIACKGESAIGAQLVQTAHACPHEVVIIDNEHERFLLHQKHRRSESCSSVKSVRIGLKIDKGLCQFECPNGVKHVTVYSHRENVPVTRTPRSMRCWPFANSDDSGHSSGE